MLKLIEAVDHQWGKVYIIKVLEGYISKPRRKCHGKKSLHLEGRAFDLTLVSARSGDAIVKSRLLERNILQRLAGLAYYRAGFSFAEVKAHHIHVSCKRRNS